MFFDSELMNTVVLSGIPAIIFGVAYVSFLIHMIKKF